LRFLCDIEGTPLADLLQAMPRRWPQTPEPAEITTLHIRLPEGAAPRQSRRKILLLEDRDDFRSVLRDHLVSCSHEVVSVDSGVEGIQEILKGPFDLIICDMMMPNIGGEMFYLAVTRVRPAAGQRFIFFTGHRNNSPIEAFFRRVNATVLYKPFKMSVLDRAIEEILGKAG
jgi:CheY-like chemotaxis protein